MTPPSPRAVREAVVTRLAAWYGLEPAAIPGDRPLAELGLTSRDAVALAAGLAELTGSRLPPTLLWDTPSLDALVTRLAEGSRPGSADEQRGGTVATAPAPGVGPVPVAVVGIGCRLPGGIDSPAAYWRLLTDGRDAVGTVPEDRWAPYERSGAPLPADLSRHGAFLDDIAGFDAEFFGIAAHEAAVMDPQQRMLLEVAREALDHAALAAPTLAGTRTGVFVGISGNEYAHLTTADPAAVDGWTPMGAALSVAAGRLSYALDLRGPSLALDTACSSSLVAVHHAARSLALGESDTALAAGVNLLLSPAVTLGFQRAGALAPDGRCKAFDAAADGMVRGEGCGVVVLRRLADAERDGDRVLAVLSATAVNSDGRSGGLTAPRPEAQRALLAQAHADTEPAAVDYVEAHGTGTPLGDPIEAGALGAVLGAGRGRAPDQPLLLGSAKTQLGHLEAAAGIAGFIKTVLALHHGEIPAQLHFRTPNPHLDLEALGLRVVTAAEPWPRYSGTATAGVSSFGFSGTNAHAVLTEYRPPSLPRRRARPAEQPSVLLLDGLTEDRVRAYAAELADWLGSRQTRPVRLADLGRTLAGRTGRGRYRAAVVARGGAEAAAALTALATGSPDGHLVTGSGTAPVGPGAVWVFSGYGSQWTGMGRRLLTGEPAFAAAVDRIDPVLREHAGLSLRDRLEDGEAWESASTDVVMPVLFGIQVALAELWRSYGLEPAAVIGHSMGEIAAAVVSGALDLASGARVVAVRSRLLAGLSGGAMAVVDRPGEDVPALARDLATVQVAVHASPTQCVVTGSAEDVAGLVARVRDAGGFARPMAVTGAGHSPDVDPLLSPFAEQLGEVHSRTPDCPRYSTVLSDPRDAASADTAYWAANLRRPVRFAQAVRAAIRDGHRLFVEVSPHPTQLHPLTENLTAEGAAGESLVLPTLRRDTDDALAFRTSLAALLVGGVRLPELRERLHPGGRIAEVPAARWRHRRHWVGETAAEATAATASAVPAEATVLDRLRACVAGVMGYGPDRLDPEIPLTDLGLDSLTAARIRTAVEREFDRTLDPGLLLRQGTLSGIARLLTAERPPALLRGFPPSGTAYGAASGVGTPLFLHHAAGGSAQVYAPLAQRLAATRPCHGMDRLDDLTEVTERAAEFAHRIRTFRPAGPWLVGGWSYGGLVAQETARLLTGHGRVSALVLLDSVLPLPGPAGLTPAALARHRFEGFAAYVQRTYGRPLSLPYEDLAGLGDEEQVELVLKLLEQTVEVPPAALEHQRTSYLDLRSGERHTPGPYEGPTLLYRATDPAPHTVRDERYERTDEALGWDAYCTDLTVRPLPGHHLSLLDPPVVDTLAGLLARDLPTDT